MTGDNRGTSHDSEKTLQALTQSLGDLTESGATIFPNVFDVKLVESKCLDDFWFTFRTDQIMLVQSKTLIPQAPSWHACRKLIWLRAQKYA